MEAAVTSLLLNDPRLSQLIGDRVYWDIARQAAAKPYLILQAMSPIIDKTMAGRSGLETWRIQADAYAETKFSCVKIARFAFEALEAARGPREGITIQGVFFDSSRDLLAEASTSKAPLFRRSTDIIIIWHS